MTPREQAAILRELSRRLFLTREGFWETLTVGEAQALEAGAQALDAGQTREKLKFDPSVPTPLDLFRVALEGADTAMPVLVTMLKTAKLRAGLTVADEIAANVKCALKVLREHSEALDAGVSRACACDTPDPVMQADGKFYCHRCSFQTGARPESLEPERWMREALDAVGWQHDVEARFAEAISTELEPAKQVLHRVLWKGKEQ